MKIEQWQISNEKNEQWVMSNDKWAMPNELWQISYDK